jgi:serine phosphatase RsbU (regulator of sigma subunit)/pSer/pThr/pTyr-binding forkhead associated (FHA) protein
MPTGRSPIPTLLTIHGETPGRLYELDRESTMIGRDLGCEIVLSRKFVSRHHARITRDALGYYIEDLQSNCGTLVDGTRISTRVLLRDGQNIKIGNYLFVFNFPAVMVTDNEESSSILGVLEVASSNGSVAGVLDPREQLRQVLEISRRLGESLRVEDVLDKTLESLFKLFPQADRSFVLLKEGEQVDFTPRAMKFRGQETGNLTISRTILKLVFNEAKGVLSSDLTLDRRFEMAQSIVGSIRMVMCVPLLVDSERRVGGILQIDTRHERGKFAQEDLDLLVAIASQVSVALDNAQLHAAMLERTAVEQESQDAREVQLALLPERRPDLPGYEFWDYYEPARFVGGDYFDYLPLVHTDAQAQAGGAPRRWLLALGDVAGKGMPAALLMARLSAEVRHFSFTMSDPARIVERLNRGFCHRAIGDRFITFQLVLVDGESHQISVVSAGHSGPLIRRGDDRLEVLGEPQAVPPLGVAEASVFYAATTPLEPGDMVLLYTDGLVDYANASSKAFGFERLKEVFRSVPRGARIAGEEILRAVREHAAGCPQNDDITVLCFERVGPRAPQSL